MAIDDALIKTNNGTSLQKEFHGFILIENLGMRFPTPNSKQKKRYVKVQCKKCDTIYEGYYALFYNKDKVCVCSSRTRPKTKSDAWTRILKIRLGMIRRCYDRREKSYSRYGAKNIIICDEWLNSLESFYEWSLINGYASHLSIDRIDNNKGYSPDNCRWATDLEQVRNRSNTLPIETVQEIKSLLKTNLTHGQIADKLGIQRNRVSRISCKMTYAEID